MARFLFTVWPFPGHIHPNVAIGRALIDQGHEVAFFTGGSVAGALEAEDFVVFPFAHVDEWRVQDTVLTLDGHSLDWRQARQRKTLLCDWLLGTVDAQLRDLDTVLSLWRPDAIVCDPAMWGPLLVTQEKEGIPLAVMSYVAACMLPGPEGPIVGLPLRRARGPLGRLGRHVLRLVAHVVGADVRRSADRIRLKHGLSPMGATVTGFAGRMPLYVVPSTPAFDRQRSDLPASVRYVGACQWDKPRATPPPSWLLDLPRDTPLVYVTEGTMHSKPPLLLRAALEGLSSASVQVVATTGAHRDPKALGLPSTPHARVERFVPHSDLLPRTDVVVTTGGTGTVLAALIAGVPLVIVPCAWDQPENAWRVAEAGAGIRVSPRKCTPERIRAAVERVLSVPAYRENAWQLGTNLAARGGADEAAYLIARLADESRTSETARGPRRPPEFARAGVEG